MFPFSFSAFCSFRPKRSNLYFHVATADGCWQGFIYPGFRFAPPRVTISAAATRLDFCGYNIVVKKTQSSGCLVSATRLNTGVALAHSPPRPVAPSTSLRDRRTSPSLPVPVSRFSLPVSPFHLNNCPTISATLSPSTAEETMPPA
jgi:hypothetical protein